MCGVVELYVCGGGGGGGTVGSDHCNTVKEIHALYVINGSNHWVLRLIIISNTPHWVQCKLPILPALYAFMWYG